MLAEPDTALSETGFEGVNSGEGLVSGDLTEQQPEVLSRIEFRGVGRQENKPEIVGDHQLRRAVPGSTVEYEQSDDVYGQ